MIKALYTHRTLKNCVENAFYEDVWVENASYGDVWVEAEQLRHQGRGVLDM